MKNLLLIIAGAILYSCSSSQFESAEINLENQWDTIRPLANSHKGWYHHILGEINVYNFQSNVRLMNTFSL